MHLHKINNIFVHTYIQKPDAIKHNNKQTKPKQTNIQQQYTTTTQPQQ